MFSVCGYSSADSSLLYSGSEKACPFTTLIILQKFLRANANNTQEASSQLTAALKWRKDFQPRKVMHEVFDKSRFGGLGYVVDLKGVPDSPNKSDVCAFNIYGGVKDMKKTFGDLEGCVLWFVSTVLETDLSRTVL